MRWTEFMRFYSSFKQLANVEKCGSVSNSTKYDMAIDFNSKQESHGRKSNGRFFKWYIQVHVPALDKICWWQQTPCPEGCEQR